VPLDVSAGTNIKVLEAMACGKAVVTTTIGCAGLGLQNEQDVFIRDDAEAFAAALSEVLTNEPLRSRVGAHARKTAETRFSWTSIAQQAYSSYRAATASERSPFTQPHLNSPKPSPAPSAIPAEAPPAPAPQ
jgi:glycosyltransferase involved in cell wall biosynthesis